MKQEKKCKGDKERIRYTEKRPFCVVFLRGCEGECDRKKGERAHVNVETF